MKVETYRKIALLREIDRQNRLIELRLKMDKAKDKRVKEQFAKMIKNLSNNQL